MSGRQAKILSKDSCDDLLVFASTTRHPLRNRLIVLLSIKAGLWAAEIANLTWEMVLTPSAEIGPTIELHDRAAKKSGGRLSLFIATWLRRCAIYAGRPWRQVRSFVPSAVDQ
jgi:hypothetical protein